MWYQSTQKVYEVTFWTHLGHGILQSSEDVYEMPLIGCIFILEDASILLKRPDIVQKIISEAKFIKQKQPNTCFKNPCGQFETRGDFELFLRKHLNHALLFCNHLGEVWFSQILLQEGGGPSKGSTINSPEQLDCVLQLLHLQSGALKWG
jgi:hypothetical protein